MNASEANKRTSEGQESIIQRVICRIEDAADNGKWQLTLRENEAQPYVLAALGELDYKIIVHANLGIVEVSWSN